MTVYAVSYLPRLLSTNNLDENIVVSMAVALILLALLTVLGITSLNVVKRIMTATTWNRAQRLSYVFFGLVFCHLAFILAPAALHGGIAAQRSLLVYTALFGAYTILRIAKAIGNGHARRPATRNPGPPARLLVRSRRKSHRLVFIHSEVKALPFQPMCSIPTPYQNLRRGGCGLRRALAVEAHVDVHEDAGEGGATKVPSSHGPAK